jgi:hypothetical protein
MLGNSSRHRISAGPTTLTLRSMSVLRVNHSDSFGEKGVMPGFEARLYQAGDLIIRLTCPRTP